MPETCCFQKLAVEATPKNINELKLQKAHEEKVAKENLEAAKAFKTELETKEVTVSIKVGENGRTFGSVSTKKSQKPLRNSWATILIKRKCSFRLRSRNWELPWYL